MSGTIPRILHQTYASHRLPGSFAGWRKGWLKNHPHWQHRFWTDTDIRDFFSEHYPDFLPIFNAYPQEIMRVDAFRYYLLYHYGGVYADLDYESLRRMDSLLAGQQILLVPEPSEHVFTGKSKRRGFSYVVSNALMGSTAKHPFWKKVIEHLHIAKDAWDPLDATGPFMLTCAHAEFAPSLPLAKMEYFIDSNGDTDARNRQVYAIHHWQGSWWRRAWYKEIPARILKKILAVLLPKVLPNFHLRAYLAKHPANKRMINIKKREESCRALVYERGKIVQDDMKFSCRDAQRKTQHKTSPLQKNTLISALLITKERPQLAMRAVDCFLRQTHPLKELVIIDEGDDRFYKELQKIKNPAIKYFRNEHKTSLGRLRNRALDLAKGEYVCQWDDDDLYHPNKMKYQLAACQNYNADACFLLREILHSKQPLALAVSNARLWEGSILVRKDAMFRYPPMRRAEDYWVIHLLAKRKRVVALDFPELYVYTYHGHNTWGKGHFARVFSRAEHIYHLSSEMQKGLAELGGGYPHLSSVIDELEVTR